MCGIAVTIQLNPSADAIKSAQALTEQMISRIEHRGPDRISIWTTGPEPNPFLAIGHARLAVVDETATYPFTLTRGNTKTVLVLNGEIYNHRQLKQHLLDANLCSA